jgi:hypothetical protein
MRTKVTGNGRLVGWNEPAPATLPGRISMSNPLQGLLGSRPKGEDAFSGVVVYEDTQTRDRAVQLCDRLVHRFWTDLAIDFTWWRFDYLRDDKLARLATEEVSGADMVVFSARGEQNLPIGVQSWIGGWSPRQRNRPAALVALIGLDGDRARGITPVHTYLRNVAQRVHMDFLTHVPDAGERWKDVFAEDLAGRAGKVTDVLDGILQRQSAPSRWGINE